MKRAIRRLRKRTKKTLIGFFAMTGILVLCSLGFIQSEYFASLVKGALDQKLPKSWGIQGDFTDFKINLFPPGLSIRNPKVTLSKKNIVHLPENSKVEAQRIDLVFYPLQMLTGELRVNETVIVNGKVNLEIDPDRFPKTKKKKKSGFKVSWSDLFQLKADSVTFLDTQVAIRLKNPDISGEFSTKYLSLGIWPGSDGLGFFLNTKIENFKANLPSKYKLPNQIQNLELNLEGNAGGVQVESILFQTQGLSGNVSGEMKGDILQPDSLSYQFQGRFEGDAKKFLALADSKIDAEGQLVFEGDMKGKLKNFVKTIIANGKLTGNSIKYQSYLVDRLDAEGKWNGPLREVELVKANLSAQETPRVGGFQPASGGNMEVGSFKYSFATPTPVVVPIKFKQAHIHWLTSQSIGGTYPLDFRITGSTLVQFVPKIEGAPDDSWQLRAEVDWLLPYFRYDNQRYKKKRPLKTLLDLKNIKLKGPILVTNKAVTPENVEFEMGETKLNIGGSVDFEKGLDLKIGGPTRLDDFDKLAEKTIKGQGRLDVHVRGPGDDFYIDFKADMKNAYYLNLLFGNFKGTITFGDKIEVLQFRDIVAKKNLTHYTAGGDIFIGDREDVIMDFNISKGDINDLFNIFDFLIDDLWWFPRSMTGGVYGDLKIRGQTDTEDLIITSNLYGKDWDFYGEKFKKVTLIGGYDRGKYFIKKGSARKYRGVLEGTVEFTESDYLVWNIKTEKFSLIDFDHIARLDVPFRGAFSLSSRGQQNKNGIDSTTDIGIERVQIRGKSFPSTIVQAKSSDGILKVKSNMNGRQGDLDLQYNFKEKTKSFFEVALREFNFYPLLLFLNPALINDPNLEGRLTGSVRIDFKTGLVEFGNGKIAIQKFKLAKKGVTIHLKDQISFDISDGNFALDNVVLASGGNEVELGLKSKKAIVNGEIKGKVDVGLFEFLSPAIVDSSGNISVDLRLKGKLIEPVLSGSGQFNSVMIRNPSLSTPVEGLSGNFLVYQNEISVRRLAGSLAGGSVIARGKVAIYPYRYPDINLKLRLRRNKIKVYPFQYVFVGGGLDITGSERPYLVAGDVVVEEGIIRESVFGAQGSIRKSAKYMPDPVTLESKDKPFFKLDINAIAPRRVFVKNDLFDAELKGKVRILNTVEAPRILGNVDVIDGKIVFKNNEFTIRNAKVNFDNPSTIDPKFDLFANAEVKNYKINMNAYGRMSDWKVDLTSDPVLPSSEIVSLLALGFTSEDMQKFGSSDRTAIQQGEAASLLLHSLDFNREVKDKTGFQIQVGEAVDTNSGRSIFRPQSNSDTTAAAPKIVIKRQIVKDVDLSVGSTVGVGTSSQQEVNAEVRIAPGVSVIGVWNTFEGVETQDEQTSYGLDLKFQKRFK